MDKKKIIKNGKKDEKMKKDDLSMGGSKGGQSQWDKSDSAEPTDKFTDKDKYESVD